MIREILLVHHSHTDIGYTHPQPVIFELHRRFIDMAIDFCEADAEFRWTCEVTGITLDWWQRASASSRERFLAAVARGQIEVAGMMWNITPLADHRMLLKLLEPIRFFRSLGVPIRSAMNSDVNGVPWGLADALLDFGIDGFSMGVNEHYGYAVQPRPGAFWWESPTKRKILVWNGLQYWNAANIHMRIPESVEAVAKAIPPYLEVWKERGYPLSFLPVQVTTSSAPDNAAPDPEIPAFVREWNASGQGIKLRLVNLTEVFDRLRSEHLPTMSGDWTDWWNFGCGSTARETSLALEGMRLLDSAHQLASFPSPDGRGAGVRGRGDEASQQKGVLIEAGSALALYAEHTWGADRSVYRPDSIETYSQLNQKLGFAYDGYLLARMANRDGLAALASEAGGEELTALVYNPNPVPVTRMVRVPTESTGFGYLAEPRLHLAHRLDTVLSDLPDESARWVGPLELPAFGYRTVPYSDLHSTRERLFADESAIGNGRIRLEFLPQGGVKSLTLDGEEFAGDSAFGFANPVLETPVAGRGGIFGPLNWRELHVHQQWHTDWEATREVGTPLAKETRLSDGCAEHRLALEMPNGDRFDIAYRVFPGEPNVEVSVALHKQPIAEAHALYLPFTIAGDPKTMRCHFETAGAVVELDREQLPYASRHYLTTMRFIRLQDGVRGLTVVCPDAPLWQVGGFNFGRHEGGEVERPEATLNAWLTNNYWDVNFCADQGGALRFRFRLIPHRAEPIERSVASAIAYATEPQFHAYRAMGPRKRSTGSLIYVDGEAIVTSVRREGDSLKVELINPSDDLREARVKPGSFDFRRVTKASLYGEPSDVQAGGDLTLRPREWTTLILER
ncbi:MAG TPA: hypothetical protein VGE01_08370 [Fimbriimonas sp.]